MKFRNPTRVLIFRVVPLIIILTSCAPVPTATQMPSVTQSPAAFALSTRTPLSHSALVVVGSTASSDAFTTRWAQLEKKIFDGIELATLISAGARGWKVVTDEEGQVQVFVDRAGGVIFLSQGPPGFRWDSENLLWRGESGGDREVVFVPDVLLAGGWHEDTQTAGPWAWADKVFLVVDEDGNYWVVIHYSPDALRQLTLGNNLISEGICPPVIDESEFAQILISLPDGSAFCMREPLIITLNPGQTITRYR